MFPGAHETRLVVQDEITRPAQAASHRGVDLPGTHRTAFPTSERDPLADSTRCVDFWQDHETFIRNPVLSGPEGGDGA